MNCAAAAPQVAERLGVCTATVYAPCDHGGLGHVRVSCAIRVPLAELEAYLKRQRGGR